MIDLRRLHVLRAVAHHGTITAAAKSLHFTTSAASQQIRQLARELGVDLLEPHGRRVRLTPAARTLLVHADAIEARWEQAEIDLHAVRDEPAGLLRLCAFPSAVSMLLAPLVARLRAQYPRLDIQVREDEQHNAFDLLFNGETDLVVVEATPGNPTASDARFDQRPLLDDVFDLVLPASHDFARRKGIALAETADLEWIIPVTANTCREHILAACGTAGFTPHVVHQVLEWNAIANMVAHGLGVCLVPRLAHLPPHLPVTRVPLRGNPKPSRKLLTCTRASSARHPAVAVAITELHRAAQDVSLA
ncbi:LysR family transcriptional regulator [Kibdelosporangium phytohabitans]|uniref:LysR family transcriptional regulator n=1 Tax=Kibdelosporangium phytohabitans TaxID=860235 RepID=A0A0N9IBH8_9PSEU|nr:LysR family transcriptional regulator [Kibdelosporangium phytohabitans]ALG12054.1 LysR family transcriptional regulator [Kibdelosporangium phytohabitans]MBE1463535.1 DNA-binding transcriptional LysR family regulator [Kibdelosporangium phytohabitans]